MTAILVGVVVILAVAIRLLYLAYCEMEDASC